MEKVSNIIDSSGKKGKVWIFDVKTRLHRVGHDDTNIRSEADDVHCAHKDSTSDDLDLFVGNGGLGRGQRRCHPPSSSFFQLEHHENSCYGNHNKTNF